MRRRLLRFLRIAERPEPPPGDRASLEIFRSSRRHLRYQYALWAAGQLSVLVGLLFSVLGLGSLSWVEELRQLAGQLEAWGARWLASPLVLLLERLEALALVLFAIEAAITGALVRLRWETRWYMVNDRAVRIREGLVFLREQTLTIANIQNLRLRQGPLQRLFGVADLEIQTAGGGPGSEGEEAGRRRAHVGRFQGIDDAGALRDRLRGSLRALQAGVPAPPISTAVDTARARSAPVDGALARAVGEARALRLALERRAAGAPR